MLSWIRSYYAATFETKVFVLSCIFFGGSIILGSLYPYLRIDFARSGEKIKKIEQYTKTLKN